MTKSSFEFLKGVNDFTYTIACAAENNYPDDPNTTLVKMRMFGEATAKHLGLLLGIPACENQHDLLRELGKIAFVDDTILSVFHKLRRIGNQAVHEYHNDLDDAQMCLRLGFRLGVWYYRLVTKNYDFAVPIFTLPERGENLYHQEVLTLKHQLEQQAREKAQSQSELAAQQQKLISLNGYIAILEGKQQETEAQTRARLAALEAQLAEKNAELAKQTEQERKAYQKEITDQAIKRTLDLSEEESRFLIDAQLRKAGWQADSKALRFSEGARPEPGVNKAIAEWPTGKDETGKQGFADYVLFVGLKPIAVVEAKRKNIDVPAKLNESYRYSKYFDNAFLRDTLLEEYAPDDVHEAVPLYEISWQDTSGEQRFKIPFCYSTNGREYRAAMKTKSGIWYRDVRHTTNMSKALPEWHRPEELSDMLGSDAQRQNQWFADNPGMSELGLRYYQEDAVRAVETAIVNGQQEILLAMATGTGKTRTAIALMFRLIQSQRFKRILFLVDRRSLGEQALGAFDDTRINGDTFNSIFDIKGLTDKFPEDSTKIHVATVQSLVKRTLQSDEPMPVGRYDCIVVDEAHRGYILDKEQTEGELQFRSQLDYVSAYRRILDHFDAIKVALTATPALHTVQIFGDPVYRYTYRTAVIDGYLIDQDPPIQITTRNAQDGVYLAQGEQVERISSQGEVINDTLEDEQDFEVADFNRNLIIPAFNRAVCNELTNYLDPTGLQKTLVFCVTNAHADMVVEELRTAFKKKYPQLEHDAIIKITGDADKDARKVQTMITRFNKERLPNIVVTVDLLTTGVDIPSICNIVFLRKVRSRILYEQMKGRATRLCPAVAKTSFKIFDCVDIYSSLESVDTMRPVVVRPQVELQTLVNEITDSETYKTIEADGRSFAEHSHEQLVAKLQRIIGLATFNRDRSETVDKQVRRLDELCQDAAGVNFNGFASCLRDKGAHWSAEVFNKLPGFISRLEKLKADINNLNDAPIFLDIDDEVVSVKSLYGDYDTPQDFLEAFDSLVQRSPNAQPALQAVINRPRDLTRKGLVELQEWFDRQHFEESSLRKAWKETRNQDIAARLIGHIRRAAVGDALKPFDERVDRALKRIKGENAWNSEQLTWLDRLATALKEKVVLDDDVFKTGNFHRRGGKTMLQKTFDDDLDNLLDKFSDYIWDEPA
ncbi:type I restriction-modification system endonuclease [[Curtobacterium] plantarum]|uniref:type I restriction-modification system endonuclease n=1 Tax=[Curtobacterium] plantarum TaxID=221276 RepID=UPI000F073B59|nr:type I restriction-modification system endonuclease [[Curtobacterium] plantarum]RNA77052.1 type I restriction-modification system endonuclease [[Curtobacterium] plantarum]